MSERLVTTTPIPATAPRKRRRPFLRKLIAAGLAFVFSFLLCEIAARIVFPAPPDPTREPPIVYVHSDEVGYLHVPYQQGWIDDGFVTINALGFRGPEPIFPKPEGSLRLLVVGSSNSVGWGVHDDRTYCAELGRQLPQLASGKQLEVLNWSVSGYKMDHKELLLRRYGLRLEPDLILLDFSDYDLFAPDATPVPSAQEPRVEAVDEPFTIPNNGNTFRLVEEPSWMNRMLRRSRALYSAKNGLYGLKVAFGSMAPRAANELALLEGRDLPAIEEAWQKVDKCLTRIWKMTSHLEGRVGILVFPVREQVSKSYPNAHYQTRLKALAKKHGFFVVDPLPRFQEHAARINELFIPYDRGHPGPLGHQLLAEAVAEAVRQRDK